VADNRRLADVASRALAGCGRRPDWVWAWFLLSSGSGVPSS